MDKITYKELESLVNILGYNVRYDWHVYIQDNIERTIASVSTTHYKQLNLNWSRFEELPDVEKDLIGNACWALASTPLEDREGPKYYYLRLKQEFSYLKQYEPAYLIRDSRRPEDMAVSNRCKMPFTQTEIEDMARKHDLSIFEKVEVEDD